MNFFERLIKSVYKFDEYGELVGLSLGSSLFYYFVVSVITIAVMCFAMFPVLAQIFDSIEEKTPEFSIEGGELVMEEPVYIQENGIAVAMNPACEDVNELAEGLTGISGIFVSKGDILVKNSFTGSAERASLSAFDDFSSDDMGVFLRIIKIVSYIVMTAIFVFLKIALLLFVWCIAKLESNIFRGGLGMKDSLKLGIYAVTLPVILKTAFCFSSFSLPNLIFYALIIVYIYLGIKCCKATRAEV